MVQRARFAGIAMIWLAAVAGVSATAWLAIDRVGRDVSVAGVVSQRPRPVGTPAVTTGADSGPSGTDVTQKPSATGTPSAAPRSSSSTRTPRAPSNTRTPRAPSNTRTPRAPSKAHNNQPSPTRSQDRTFTISGGQVSVRCTGARIALRIAQPDNGWRVEVDHAGPEEVKVRFQRVGDNAGRGSRMVTVCAKGSPALRVDNKG